MKTSGLYRNRLPGLLGTALLVLLFASHAAIFAQDEHKKGKSTDAAHQGRSSQPANQQASPSTPSGGQSGGSPSHGNSGGGTVQDTSRRPDRTDSNRGTPTGDVNRGGSSTHGSAGSTGQDTGRHYGQTDSNRGTPTGDVNRGGSSSHGSGGGTGQDSGRHYGQTDSNGGTPTGDVNRGGSSSHGSGGGTGQDTGRHYGQTDSNRGTPTGDVNRGGSSSHGSSGGTGQDTGRHYGQTDSNRGTPTGDVNRGGGSHDTYRPADRTDVNHGGGRVDANRGGGSHDSNRGPAPSYGNRGSGPRPEFHGNNGASARFDHSGRPTVVHTHDSTIIHVGGARRYEVVRPGGRIIVTNSHGYGYMQRPVVVRGHEFVQRSYYVNGVSYTRVYRPWVYRGITFNVYTPVRYYNPRFYVWAYSPWRTPVYYSWGWTRDPWYGYYGGYFTPYPAYSSPSLWLTDFLIAASLREAYQERAEAAAAQDSLYAARPVPMSPQVKQMIADEVQRQLLLERSEGERMGQNAMPASSGAPPIFADGNPHVFVVGTSLMAGGAGQDCPLTQGDVLQLTRQQSPDPNFANVQVLASKGQDCSIGSIVPVQLVDLQEMDNHMRAMIDQGMGDLQTHQGQSGLPPIEASLRTETPAPYAAELPPPEQNVSSQLQQQAQDADRQEQEVLGQAGSQPDSGATPTVTLGQSIDEVVAILGKPSKIVDLGQKKTYVYSDMKIVFMDGRVSDVQ